MSSFHPVSSCHPMPSNHLIVHRPIHLFHLLTMVVVLIQHPHNVTREQTCKQRTPHSHRFAARLGGEKNTIILQPNAFRRGASPRPPEGRETDQNSSTIIRKKTNVKTQRSYRGCLHHWTALEFIFLPRPHTEKML